MGGFLQTPSGATASRGPSVRAPEKKEGETMTQKEKYRRAASAMRKALLSIMSDGPSTEYLLRATKEEIRASLTY